MVKNFFVDKKVKVMNDAHLRIVNMNNETVGHYDRTILNNGGSDFLLLNEKELKKLDILFDHTAGELEKYL
jgi:NhaP-type Na+/H+ and K+/H+ antiporter